MALLFFEEVCNRLRVHRFTRSRFHSRSRIVFETRICGKSVSFVSSNPKFGARGRPPCRPKTHSGRGGPPYVSETFQNQSVV